ncbi:MAG: ATP-binding cassette domain-containing protein, partial [candidate division Zixibacteria bacterium]|nr:ATP-binding cassette domain-containing protein [candidate division Zixibacteria bacterium]
MADAFISIRDLFKGFGAQEVLSGVSFDINKGESVAIIGQSGCGKSVLLKHLIQLLEPDSGQVLVEGEDVIALHGRALVKHRSRVGML